MDDTVAAKYLWGYLVNIKIYRKREKSFIEFKRNCPWIDLQKKNCIPISCIGWGGDDCKLENCAFMYFMQFINE